MKYVKYLVVALAITAVMAASGVSAAGYQSYVGFSIPALQKKVNAGTLTKTDYKNHVIGVLSTQSARDFYVNLTGKGISGATGTSPWILVEVIENSPNAEYTVVKKINTETTSEAYGMAPGDVTMNMKTRNLYFSTTYFNGAWYVSESVYDQLN